MSAAVNSITGAQSGSIGRGAGGSASGEESGASESRVSQGTRLVFGSVAVYPQNRGNFSDGGAFL